MRSIVLSLVLLAVAALVVAQTTTTLDPTTTPTPAPGPTTTGGPGTTAAPITPSAIFGGRLVGTVSANTTATGLMIGFHDTAISKLTFHLMHNLASATSVSFVSKVDGTTINTVTANIAANQLITGTVTFTGSYAGDIYNNNVTIRVTSATATIETIIGFAPYANWRYVGFLNSAATNTSSSNGVGLMIAGGGDKFFTPTIQHNVTDATSVTINGAANTCQTGALMFTMPSASVSTSTTFETATPATFATLDNNQAYVNVVTAGFPAGAIRGQIYKIEYFTTTGAQKFQAVNCQSSTTPTPTKSNAVSAVPSMIVMIVAAIVALVL